MSLYQNHSYIILNVFRTSLGFWTKLPVFGPELHDVARHWNNMYSPYYWEIFTEFIPCFLNCQTFHFPTISKVHLWSDFYFPSVSEGSTILIQSIERKKWSSVSLCLSPVWPSACLFDRLTVCLIVCLSDCLSVSLIVCLFVCPSVRMSVCLSACPSICPSIRMSVYLCRFVQIISETIVARSPDIF